MARGRGEQDSITPALLLKACASGIFPMADSADDPSLFWVEPRLRGLLPLDSFHVPRRLARTIRSGLYQIRADSDFEGTIHGCAVPQPGRRVTWINATIRRLYGDLFRMGYVHTVETWRDGALVGGLYGLALGSAFFGESMFSRERDASKVALAHLVVRLRAGGFTLLDTQFLTGHLAQFGGVEVAREDYMAMLSDALLRDADFSALDSEQPERQAG